MKVIKKQLVEKLADKINCSRTLSLQVIEALFHIMFDELAQGNKVVLPYIGTLLPVLHKARKSGQIKNDNYVMIPEALRVRLLSSLYLKQKMKELKKSQAMNNVSFFK